MFIVISQEELILLVQDYVYDNVLPIYSFYTRKSGYFQQQSHALWASEELISCISKRETDSPIEALQDFVDKMERFSAGRNTKTNHAFKVAHNLSSNILDICRCAGWLD